MQIYPATQLQEGRLLWNNLIHFPRRIGYVASQATAIFPKKNICKFVRSYKKPSSIST